MCLKTYNAKVSVAHGGRRCYKLLVSDGVGHLFTPYSYTLIENDIINGKKLFKAKGKPDIESYENEGIPCKIVSGGYIHTFMFASDALRMAENWNNPHVYRCIIPDKKRYYTGKDNLDNTCLASKAIKFIDEMDETKNND